MIFICMTFSSQRLPKTSVHHSLLCFIYSIFSSTSIFSSHTMSWSPTLNTSSPVSSTSLCTRRYVKCFTAWVHKGRFSRPGVSASLWNLLAAQIPETHPRSSKSAISVLTSTPGDSAGHALVWEPLLYPHYLITKAEDRRVHRRSTFTMRKRRLTEIK